MSGPLERKPDTDHASNPSTAAASRYWLERLTPWLPIAMLVVAASVAIMLRVRVGGSGPSTVVWVTVSLVAAGAAWRAPGHALLTLILLLPVAPYFRSHTWLGKSLPFVLTAAVLIGVALSRNVSWGQLLRDRRRHLATPMLAFAAVLSVSIVLVLLQRSPFLSTLASTEWTGGVLGNNWAALQPQSTLPILRGGGFLLGPVCSLVLVSLLTLEPDKTHRLLDRERVITAFLLTSALNLGVACGQVFVPGFPIETIREPVSGLFHNPVGLSLQMTLAAPVALAVSLRPSGSGWVRGLAIFTVVLIALMFVPIRQRSAHLGVVTGVACLLTASGLRYARSDKKSFRRVVAAAAALTVILALGLVGAFARTSQWRQTVAAISDAPLSAVWLGMDVRGETNRLAFFMAGDRPLGGYGVGGFEAALPAYYERYGPAVRRYDYHSILNHPLHMLVDLGVLGLAVNLWLLCAFLFPSRRTPFGRAGPAGRHTDVDLTALGCTAGAGAVFFLSIWTGESMYDAPNSVGAFALLALAASSMEVTGGRRRGPTVWVILALPVLYAVAFVVGV